MKPRTLATLLALVSFPTTACGENGDVLNSGTIPSGLSTSAITTTPLDTIYVPELFGTTTFILDLELNVTGFIDSPASSIRGIAYVDPPGPAVPSLFWLSDEIILVTDLGGLLLDSYGLNYPFGATSGNPRGLAWDPDSNRLWTCDRDTNICFQFFLDGELTGNIFVLPSDGLPTGISRVGGGSECYDVALQALPAGYIARVQPNGSVQGTAPGDGEPQPFSSITWHPTGSTGSEVVYAIRFGDSAIVEVELSLPCGPAGFIRGDSNGDGSYVPLVDAVHLLDFGFTGGPPPPCMKAADADGNESVQPLIDAVFALTHGFNGGPPPPAPHPDCGDDGSSLSCDDTSGCDP